MTTESDPTGTPQGAPGAKLDAGKAPIMRGVLHFFPRAIRAVAERSEHGNKAKYAWAGWKETPDGINRYGDALSRHVVDEAIEGPVDTESGQLHAIAVAWNALARLELILIEEERKTSTQGPVPAVALQCVRDHLLIPPELTTLTPP